MSENQEDENRYRETCGENVRIRVTVSLPQRTVWFPVVMCLQTCSPSLIVVACGLR